MKVDRIRAREAGMALGCALGLTACVVLLIADGAETWGGWALAAALVIGVVVGTGMSTGTVSRLFTAPPAPSDVTHRRGSFVSGLVSMPGIMVGVLAGGAVARVTAGEELFPDGSLTGAAIGFTAVLTAAAIRSAIVLRTVVWIERRWPVQLVEGSAEPWWLSRARTAYAIHLPAPVPSVRPEGPYPRMTDAHASPLSDRPS